MNMAPMVSGRADGAGMAQTQVSGVTEGRPSIGARFACFEWAVGRKVAGRPARGRKSDWKWPDRNSHATAPHSISSVARSNITCGIVMPSALALPPPWRGATRRPLGRRRSVCS